MMGFNRLRLCLIAHAVVLQFYTCNVVDIFDKILKYNDHVIIRIKTYTYIRI
ncbi:MAG: hypothetical protein ACI8ZB_003373 [Desulforhopalus sp.]